MPINVAIEDLLPHSGPSVFLDRLVSVDEDQIRCAVVVTPGRRFITERGVGTSIVIEWMAQAIAAFAGFQRLQQSEPIEVGFLISCRLAEFHIPWLAPGTECEVRAHVLRIGGAQMGSFACEVLSNDEVVATATLNVYQGKLKGGPN